MLDMQHGGGSLSMCLLFTLATDPNNRILLAPKKGIEPNYSS